MDDREPDDLVRPGTEIAPDAHVGVRTPEIHPSAAPSVPRPDALVEGELVGDGHELERDPDGGLPARRAPAREPGTTTGHTTTAHTTTGHTEEDA